MSASGGRGCIFACARSARPLRASSPVRARVLPSLLVLALAWLTPTLARAAGGVSRETFESVLTGFAIVGAAYLISHLVFERLARRYAIVSGVEYLLLGALAGPVFGLISGSVRTSLHPFMVLGTSALAMMAGMELDLRKGGFRARDLAIAALIVGVTAALFLGPPALAFLYLGRPDLADAWILPLVAALSVALIADAGPVRAFTAFFAARGPELARAERVAALLTAAGLVAFGSLFCFSDGLRPGWVHDGDTALRLAILQTALGLCLGGVFTLFLRRRLSHEQRLTVVIGMITFAAGLAYFIHISAIAANFLVGVVVANASRQSGEVRGMLREIRRPFYIVLFFFTGVDLIIDVPIYAYALALPYVLLRLWGRRLGGALGRRFEARSHIPSNLGNALTAPGGLSIGVCLMILLFFASASAGSPAAAPELAAAADAVAATAPEVVTEVGDAAPMRIITAALIVGVVLSEVMAYVLTRRWILDAADVAPERATRRGGFTDEEG